MKTASGQYVNIFSEPESGYDNLGLKDSEKIDIFIIFPEYMSDTEIDINHIEEIVNAAIKKFTATKEYQTDTMSKLKIKENLYNFIKSDLEQNGHWDEQLLINVIQPY